MELKRSLELINVQGKKIEESLVAIANSKPLEDSGWIFFGIDDSLEILGRVDLKGTGTLNDQILKARQQQLSQIAKRVEPSLQYTWFNINYKGKDIVAIKLKTRKPGSYYVTSDGKAPYRIDDVRYFADQTQIRIWLDEPKERIKDAWKTTDTSLTIYLSAIIFSFIAFLFWIITPFNWLNNTIPIFLLVGATVLFFRHMRLWENSKILEWCKTHSQWIIWATISIFLTSLIFETSLSLYPALSRIIFITHLSDVSRSSGILVFIVVAVTIILFNPTIKKIDLRKKTKKLSIYLNRNRKRIFTLAVVSFIVGISIVPSDIYLAIGTPKVGFIEKRNIIDNTIYIYQKTRFEFSAYARNIETIHFISPNVFSRIFKFH